MYLPCDLEENEFIKTEAVLKVTITSLSTCKKKLTISLESQTVEITRKKIIRDAYRMGSVSGFRAGKAPMSLFMKQYGDHIEKELKISLIRESYTKALEENTLNPLDRKGDLEVKMLDDGGAEYQIEIEVEPEFELQAYQDMTVEYLKSPQFTQELLDTEIRVYRERMAEYQPGKTIDTESIAYLDIIHLDDQGQEISGTHRDKMVVTIKNNQIWPKELIQGLTGMNIDQEKEVFFTYPEKNKDFAGQTVKARIRVVEIKHLVLPELNQAFLETKLQNKFKTIEEFKAQFEEELQKHLLEEAKQKRREGLIRQLLKYNPLEVPDSVVHNQFYSHLEQARTQLEHIPPNQQKSMQTYYYLKSLGDTKLHYILKKIEQIEKIEVTQDEVNLHLAEMAESQNMDAQAIKRELIQSGNFIRMKNELLESKIFYFLGQKNTWLEVEAYTQEEEKAVDVPENIPVAGPEEKKGKEGE